MQESKKGRGRRVDAKGGLLSNLMGEGWRNWEEIGEEANPEDVQSRNEKGQGTNND